MLHIAIAYLLTNNNHSDEGGIGGSGIKHEIKKHF
jgi:hypothetical protein